MKGNAMKDLLKKFSLEDLVLAYTIKTSKAETPEEFISDCKENLQKFQDLNESKKWLT